MGRKDENDAENDWFNYVKFFDKYIHVQNHKVFHFYSPSIYDSSSAWFYSSIITG